MAGADFRQWHRLFGITLTDLFSDSPWQVELEKELALTSQLLDVAIIARTAAAGPAPPGWVLPDGLDDLRSHNLLTYKSQHEALTGWVLDELVSHYVNYRKLVGPKDRLAPEANFGLYGVAVRYPRDLAERVPLRPAGPAGVFDILWGARHIRLVVLSEIEHHPRNAVWELSSARTDRIQEAARWYRPRRAGVFELLSRLYLAYALEAPQMPYTMEEFIRESHREIFRHLTPEQRRAIFQEWPPEERLQGLAPEERLRGLGLEDRLRGLAPEDILRGLGPEERQKLLDYLVKPN